MKIVWNLISLSISLWSRLLISLLKLHVSKLDKISIKAMAATKKYSNQSGFSSLICSIKLSVLLFIILMLIVLMPNINRLKIFRDSWRSRLSYLHFYLPPKDDIHYFCLLIIFRILEMPIRLRLNLIAIHYIHYWLLRLIRGTS